METSFPVPAHLALARSASAQGCTVRCMVLEEQARYKEHLPVEHIQTNSLLEEEQELSPDSGSPASTVCSELSALPVQLRSQRLSPEREALEEE